MLLAVVRSAEQWTWVSRIVGVAMLIGLVVGVALLFSVTTRR
jgi:cell division protein FtsX